MQLSDTLLPYLLEYLHKSQSRHQSLKLVRNNLTDEGMRVLLGYLVSDDCTQELNLTNNQLTGRSLEWIAIFAKRNSILKTFYLTNNKVSARELKEWREEFAKHDLKVVV